MKKILVLFLTGTAMITVAQNKKTDPNIDAAIQSVNKHQQELISVSDKIWPTLKLYQRIKTLK